MLRPLRNIRIRNKLFLGYSCAFLLAFTVAGAIIYTQVRSIIEQTIEAELTTNTETIQSMVLSNADVSIKNYMRAVAEKNLEIARQLHREVRRGRLTEEEAKRRAKEAFLSQTIGKTGHIYCLDSDGILVMHPRRSLVGVDVSALPFAREQIENKTGYMEYDWREPLETTSRPKALYMSYFEPWDWIISASAYRDEFGELVNIDDFRKRILELGSGRTGYPFVIGYDGFLLMHPHLEGYHYTKFNDPVMDRVGERIVREKNGHFEYDWRNPGEDHFRRKVVYFKDIPDLKWIVASSSYFDDFQDPLNAVGYVILFAMVAAVVLLIPLSIWLGASITRPLNTMQDKFAQAAGGDFSVRMHGLTKDELGLLSGYFNSFMEKLTEYSDDLQNEIAVRKRAEKKLIALDRAKSLFLASASHELRTPLTSMIGFLKLMQKKFNKKFLPHLEGVDGLAEPVSQFVDNLKIVRSEADRLGLLVNDLLDLSKIESGRMEWREDELLVGDVLKRAAEAIKPFAETNRKVRLVCDNTDDAGRFTADGDRIHQVLINLLSNAFKYTEEGTVTLSALCRRNAVEFAVRDTGLGIPEEARDKVFDLFYQVQDVNMRSSKTFGTGLGLAICKEIVAHYGGELGLESKDGVGSCFTFSIPASCDID